MIESTPIGVPLSNYRCLIIDEFLQNVMVNQEGELFVGGVGVFAGYLGRDDLTTTALIEIGGEIFYRTGDLVRMDHNGLLHYQGRKDYQIKLHGQRIELGEIERCLLNTSISACVVMKWGDDHLVTYVQTSDINEEQLREHCQSHLPPHMIPSIFMILEKLPLNANGKIDRKNLPAPNFSHLSSRHLTNNVELSVPTNELQVIIHQIWCNIFQQNQISIDTNIFTIGGHSLLLMQLLHRYKTQFHVQTNTLSIADLFQYPTIAGHSELIRQTHDNTPNINDCTWLPLNLIQGKTDNFFYYFINFLLYSYHCRSSIICSRTNLFR
jgi:aryl carrier-like protein